MSAWVWSDRLWAFGLLHASIASPSPQEARSPLRTESSPCGYLDLPGAPKHPPRVGEYLNRPDAELWTERQGSGPLLIVLHGDVDHRLFHPIFDHVADFAEVLLYDRRGYGATQLHGPAPADPQSPDRDIDDLLAILDSRSTASASLLALSGGGPLALETTLRHPERVERLVLLSTYCDENERVALAQERVASVLHDPRRLEGLAALDERTSAVLDAKERSLREFQVLPHVYHHSPIAPEIVRLWFELDALHVPADEARAPHRSQWGRVAALGPALGAIDVPTLILCGTYDAITPLALSRAMAEAIPGSRLGVLEQSGHLAFAEETGRVLELLEEFLHSSDQP